MSTPHPHCRAVSCRREFLTRAGGGFGALALASLLGPLLDTERELSAASPAANPLAAKKPHHPAKAKSVIWLFMDGGPSHIDLFDPKPALLKYAGQPLPPSFPRPMTAMGSTANTPLLPSKRSFKQHGRSGAWVSDWYPEIASVADDLAFVRSCQADGQTHVGSVFQMNTGAILPGRPSVGAWTLYGLGTECQNLPGFVVMTDTISDPPGGNRNWGPGFMPATYQGTRFREGKTPIIDLAPAASLGDAQQRGKLDFVQQLNRRHHAQGRSTDDSLEARIASYELAYRMQTAAPEAVDLSSETAETLALYGVDRPMTRANGQNCLLARRLVERGVRFVQLYMGAGTKWDAHTDVESNHSALCEQTDRPIAGLLKDLKRRGLLESTLVIWGGEFGRTPMSESGNGRDHNPFGFTMWFAGGGVKAGTQYGATDELGLYASENKRHIRDVHATILSLLGLEDDRLTFEHNGRDERLSITGGSPIREIMA